MARPTKFNTKVSDEICRRIADGESLRKICADEDMPSRRAVLYWLDSNEGFCAKCARARVWQADALEEEMAEIEEKTLSGEIDSKAANVVLSSKRWRASKLSPKKYGDKLQTELTGANGGAIEISDTERAAKVTAILAQAQSRREQDAIGYLRHEVLVQQ